MEKVYETSSAEETLRAAEEFGARLRGGDAVLYEGEPGAGKTAFTKGLAPALGITEPITSPTFAIVNEYEGNIPLFHFDLYRLESYDDLYAMGFFDYLGRNGVIAAEWSENIPGLADDLNDGKRVVYTVRIEKTSENGRRITISSLNAEEL